MLTTFSNQLSNIYPIIKPPINYDPTLNPVGMDAGTTRCCAAVNRNDGINVVAIDNSDRPLPSYIEYEEKVPKCGKIVYSRIKHHFKSTVFDIKRIIGKSFGSIVIDLNWPFKVFEENGSVKIATIGCETVEISLSPEEFYLHHQCWRSSVRSFGGVRFSGPVRSGLYRTEDREISGDRQQCPPPKLNPVFPNEFIFSQKNSIKSSKTYSTFC